MANEDLGYASTNLEAYRASLLDVTGNYVADSAGLYVCSDGISLATAFTNQAGTTYLQNAGNGLPCVNRVGPTVQSGAQVTLAICKWQYALMHLLMGGKTVEDDDGNVIGWSMPDPDEISTRRICLEAWTLAIDGENVADYGGAAAYNHHIFPSASVIVDDFTLADAVNVFGLVFTVSPNNNAGHGPLDDWPDFLTADGQLDEHPTGPWSSYLDADPPTALCQTQSLSDPGS